MSMNRRPAWRVGRVRPMTAITLRESPAQAARLRQLSAKRQVSVSRLIRRAIRTLGRDLPTSSPKDLFNGLTRPRRVLLPDDLLLWVSVAAIVGGVSRSEVVRAAIYSVYG